MTSMEAYEPPPGLFGRMKRLIWDPPAAWDAIAREEASGRPLGGHVAPLALLMTLSGLLGALLAAGFVFNNETLIVEPVAALIRFVLAFVGVIGFARLADALAPRFGATANSARAMQLSAYSATGVLLAGVSMLIPAIAPYVIALGGVFSMVLAYIGLPRMMGVPEEKRIGYFWSMLGVMFVAVLVISFAYGPATDAVRAMGHHLKIGEAPEMAPEPVAPIFASGAPVDAAALKRFGEASGAGAPINPEALEGFLPQSLPGGFSRTAYSAAPAGVVAQAEAAYTRGDARLVITITHLGRRSATLAMDAAARALAVRQDATGYARHQITDGRLVAETRAGDTIAYLVIGHGLAVNISGAGGATMDDARAAVETIGMARLEAAFPR
jgi:hypothetical protein